MRKPLGAMGVAAWLVVACAGGEPTWEQLPTTNKPRKHVMVQFTDATVSPSIARLTPGGTISWVNYSTIYSGSVVFPATISEVCSDLRPDFMEIAAGYQSIPISGEMDDVAFPCPLPPGSYDYEIWLFQGGPLGGPGDMDDPQARAEASIVVE